ncbi:MAG: nucleoside-diphosphate kinase [bacterium]
MIEKTLIIIKPHAVSRGLVGEIITRFEKKNFTILHLKAFRGDISFWQKFYPSDELWLKNAGTKAIKSNWEEGINPKERLGTDDPIEVGRLIKGWLTGDMSSGMVVAFIVEGNDVEKKARLICGATLPNKADPGTIRFDFSSDTPSIANDQRRSLRNVVHCADPEEMRDGKKAFDYETQIIFPEIFFNLKGRKK